MIDLRVTIAGLAVAVVLPHAGWLPPLAPRLGRYQSAPNGPPDATLRVTLDPDLGRAPGGEPRVEAEAGGLVLRHDQFEGRVPAQGPATLTIFQAEPDPVDPTYTMVVDSLLRLVMARLLTERGGAMFHAAGIKVGPEAAYMFFGPSGSGKTTVCRLSHPRYRVLCDEIVAVRPDPDGTYRLYGTPFAGAWGDSLAEDAPLRELFYLHQAPENRRVPLSRARALSVLMESAVAYQADKLNTERLMDALLTMLDRVPLSQLDFVAKETLWETVLPPMPSR